MDKFDNIKNQLLQLNDPHNQVQTQNSKSQKNQHLVSNLRQSINPQTESAKNVHFQKYENHQRDQYHGSISNNTGIYEKVQNKPTFLNGQNLHSQFGQQQLQQQFQNKQSSLQTNCQSAKNLNQRLEDLAATMPQQSQINHAYPYRLIKENQTDNYFEKVKKDSYANKISHQMDMKQYTLFMNQKSSSEQNLFQLNKEYIEQEDDKQSLKLLTQKKVPSCSVFQKMLSKSNENAQKMTFLKQNQIGQTPQSSIKGIIQNRSKNMRKEQDEDATNNLYFQINVQNEDGPQPQIIYPQTERYNNNTPLSQNRGPSFISNDSSNKKLKYADQLSNNQQYQIKKKIKINLKNSSKNTYANSEQMKSGVNSVLEMNNNAIQNHGSKKSQMYLKNDRNEQAQPQKVRNSVDHKYSENQLLLNTQNVYNSCQKMNKDTGFESPFEQDDHSSQMAKAQNINAQLNCQPSNIIRTNTSQKRIPETKSLLNTHKINQQYLTQRKYSKDNSQKNDIHLKSTSNQRQSEIDAFGNNQKDNSSYQNEDTINVKSLVKEAQKIKKNNQKIRELLQNASISLSQLSKNSQFVKHQDNLIHQMWSQNENVKNSQTRMLSNAFQENQSRIQVQKLSFFSKNTQLDQVFQIISKDISLIDSDLNKIHYQMMNSEDNLNQLETGLKNLLHTYPQSTLNQILSLQDSWKNLKKENKYFESQLNLKIAENEKLEKMKKELDDRLYLKQFQSEGLQKMLDECRSDNQLLIKKVDLLQQNLISKQKKKFDIGTSTTESFKMCSDQNNDKHLVLLCQTQKFLEAMKNLQKSLNLSKKSQCEETQMQNRKQKQKFEQCQKSLEDTIRENIQFLEKEFENSQNEQYNQVQQKNVESEPLGKTKLLNQLDDQINKLQNQNSDLALIIEEKDIYIHKLKFKEDNLLTQNKLLQNQTTILQQQILNLNKNLKAQNDEAQRLNQIKKDKQTQTIVQKIKKIKKSQIQILESLHLQVMPDQQKINQSLEEIQQLKMKLAKSDENLSQQIQEKQILSQQLGRQEQSMDILKQQIQSMQDLQIELQEQSQIIQKDSCQNCGLMQEQTLEFKIQIQDNLKQISEVNGQKSYFQSKIEEILQFFEDKIDFQSQDVESKIQKIQKYLADIEQDFRQTIFEKEQTFILRENVLKNQQHEKEQHFNNIISLSQQNHNEQISQLTQIKTEEINQKQAQIDQLQFQINENKQNYLLEINQLKSQSQQQISELQSLNQSLHLEKNQTQNLYNQQYNDLLNKRNQIEDNLREHLRVHQDCQSIIHQLNENLKNSKDENESLQEMLVLKEEEIQKEKEDLRAIDAERADLEGSLENHVLTLSENRELISMLKEQVKKSVEKQKEQTQIISIQKEKIYSFQNLDQEKVQLKNVESQTYETVESMRILNEENLKKQSFLQQQISNLKIQFSDKFSDSEEQIIKYKFINEQQEHQMLAQQNKIEEYQNQIQQFKDQIQNILMNYGIEIDQQNENLEQISLQNIEKLIEQQSNEIENLQQVREGHSANEQKQLFQAYEKLNQAEQALIQGIEQNRIYKEKAQMKIQNYKRFIDKLEEDKKQEIVKIIQEQNQAQESKTHLIQDQLHQKNEIIESKEKEIKDLQLKIQNLNQQMNIKLSELQQINDDLINEILKQKQVKGNNIQQYEQSEEDSSSSKGSEIEQLENENMGLINKLQNSEKEIQNLRDQIYALKHSNNEGQLNSQESQNLTLENINKIKNIEHQFFELKNIILKKHIEVLKDSANNYIQNQFEDKIKQIQEACQKDQLNEETQQRLQMLSEQKDDIFVLYNDLIDMRIKIEDNIDLLDEKELVIMKDDLQYFQSENIELKLKVQTLIIKNNHLQIQNDQNQNGHLHFKQISKDSGKNAVDISSIDLEIANNCDLLEQSQNMIINNSLQSFKVLSNQNIEKEDESSMQSSQLKEQESQVIEIKSGFSQSLQKIENSAEVSKISEQIDELINQALSLQDQHECKQQLQSLAENVKQQIIQLQSGTKDEKKLDENSSFASDSSKKSSSSQYLNLLQHIKATLIIYLKKNPIIDTQNESLLKIIQSMMKFTQDEINDLDQARKKLPVYVVDQSYQKKLQNLMSSKKSNNELKKEQLSSYKSDHKQNQIDEINNYYVNDGEDGKKPLSKAKKAFQGLFSKRSDSKQNESRSNNESHYSSHQKNLYSQTAQKQKDSAVSNYQDDEIQKYGSNSSNK